MAIVMKNGGLERSDRYGPNAIRSVEALLRELKATARRGYGVASSEAEFGVTAVAAAIRSDKKGPAVGTVSIAGPSARIDSRRAEELAPLVLRTARELALLWPLRAGTRPRNGESSESNGGPRSAVAV
jgi:DNA-binding IclR family transcriptional regulator